MGWPQPQSQKKKILGKLWNIYIIRFLCGMYEPNILPSINLNPQFLLAEYHQTKTLEYFLIKFNDRAIVFTCFCLFSVSWILQFFSSVGLVLSTVHHVSAQFSSHCHCFHFFLITFHHLSHQFSWLRLFFFICSSCTLDIPSFSHPFSLLFERF